MLQPPGSHTRSAAVGRKMVRKYAPDLGPVQAHFRNFFRNSLKSDYSKLSGVSIFAQWMLGRKIERRQGGRWGLQRPGYPRLQGRPCWPGRPRAHDACATEPGRDRSDSPPPEPIGAHDRQPAVHSKRATFGRLFLFRIEDKFCGVFDAPLIVLHTDSTHIGLVFAV